MGYVTPTDMAAIYDATILVQATNYSDRRATTINTPILSNACENASRLVDGYLLGLGIPVEDFSSQFLSTLKTHTARLAMDVLAGTDPQIREQAKESMDWLKWLSRLSPAVLQKLVTDKDTPITPVVPSITPTVEFDEGTRWKVTW